MRRTPRLAIADRIAEKMDNGFHALPPIPASCEGGSRFRGDLREFLKEIPRDCFRLTARSEQIHQPDGKTRRMNERCVGHYEWLLMRSRPCVILCSARCVRFTADTPFAVT